MSDRRESRDRRQNDRGGRRVTDKSGSWTPVQLARHIGMSPDFVRNEIREREIHAAQFGRDYRIPIDEVLRYLTAKGFPIPETLAS